MNGEPLNPANPVPQGKYVSATRYGNLVFTAGMTPRSEGVLIFSGKVKTSEAVECYKEAVIIAVGNALTAVRNMLTGQEKIAGILALTVYVNAEETFEQHSKLADFASEYLFQQIGPAGIGSRAAVGVASLPGNAPVEIQLIACVA